MVLTLGWLMPYEVMCTAKGPTARCRLWGWMLLRRATARVWERRSLIHMASVRDDACDSAVMGGTGYSCGGGR